MCAERASKTAFETAALSVPVKVYSRRLALSLILLIVLCYSLQIGGSLTGIFILTVLNLLFCSDILLKNAWHDIERGYLSLSVLTACSIICAFCYSLSKTFFIKPLAGNIANLYIPLCVCLVLYLWICRRDARSKEKTKVFIKKLNDFLPKSGRLCQGEREIMVFARELKKGDVIYVKAGETIPCEGVITKGETRVDESLITGNILPAKKIKGAHVYAGTLNKGSDIFVKVEKIFEESVIFGIINAIKNSERQRCVRRDPLDRYAPWMFLWMVGVSMVAYLYVYAGGDYIRPLHSVGIFLLAAGLGCPWGFFLADVLPSWFLTIRAKRKKIHIQALGALEILKRADTIFFDKTGTLTYGELRVSKVQAEKGKTVEEVIQCLITAEQFVDGPFAAAITKYAREKKIAPSPLLSFDVFPSLGVKAMSKTNEFLAGRPEWLREQGIALSKLPTGQYTLIGAAKDGKYLGYVLLEDTLRPGAAEMIEFLKNQHKEIILMSGDNEASVKAIAKEVGIDMFNSDVLPQTKAEIVGNCISLGKKIVMVGDGFNDITALLRADAGIVFVSGKNVYNNWVDIIVNRPDLHSIPELFVMYRFLKNCIKGNVILSMFGYGLLVGLLLFVPVPCWQTIYVLPLCLLMGIVLVFLNSVRLLYK